MAMQQEDKAMDLSIIIVTWNVWPLLAACLESIARFSRPGTTEPALTPIQATATTPWRTFGPTDLYRLEVIVIDNGGTDETATMLPVRFPWVRYQRSAQNLGFTAGNNLGYQMSHGDAIFFLNPDTELVAGAEQEQEGAGAPMLTDPLTMLLRALQTDPTLGMVGPQLRYGDGSWQNSRRHFPTRWTGFFESTWLGQYWANNPWSRQMHMHGISPDRQQEVDWLNGSAMFCRRSALEAIRTADTTGTITGTITGAITGAITGTFIGPFDEQFFMYSEELDLCQRMRGAGWRISYLPSVCILHYEGRSSEQVVVQRHIRFNTSKVRYYQKYFGTPWAKLLRAYLRFEYRIQICLESTKLRLGHKPDLRRARIDGYWAILNSGFPLR